MFTRTIIPTNNALALKVEKTANRQLVLTAVLGRNHEIRAVVSEDEFGVLSLKPGQKKDYLNNALKRAYLSNLTKGELHLYFEGGWLVCLSFGVLKKVLAEPWWWPF